VAKGHAEAQAIEVPAERVQAEAVHGHTEGERGDVILTGEVTEFLIRRDGFQRGSWQSHWPFATKTHAIIFGGLLFAGRLSKILIGDATSAGKVRRRAISVDQPCAG
jgi:hypothetical protein